MKRNLLLYENILSSIIRKVKLVVLLFALIPFRVSRGVCALTGICCFGLGFNLLEAYSGCVFNLSDILV